MSQLTFRKGAADGVPIALGYFSVAFAFGMLAVTNRFPVWTPLVISLTNFTGTGQFAGLDLLRLGASFFEIACTMLIINVRYVLMSLSLSQKLDGRVTLWQRLLIAFGNTDEIYAVSMGQPGTLCFPYMMGLILCSFSGWVGGTAVGALCGGFFPDSVIRALGIALYAMFIAIIIPPARDYGPIAKIILLAVLLSCLFWYVPGLSELSNGWVIIICGVVSAGVGALLFPVEESEETADE